MRRPVSVTVLSLIVLGVLAAPLAGVKFSQTDSRTLPASNPAAIATAVQAERFPGQTGNPIEIIIPGGAAKSDEVNSYLTAVAAVDGVVLVNPPRAYGEDLRVTAIHSMLPRSPEAQKLIHDLRDLTEPAGTIIGGVAADYTDSQDGIASTLPLAFGWIAISVLILLFLFTGSIILPIKAIILNVLSLAATMGVLTWVFIDGHLKWLVGDFTVTGSLDTSIVILIAVVVFGLSMTMKSSYSHAFVKNMMPENPMKMLSLSDFKDRLASLPLLLSYLLWSSHHSFSAVLPQSNRWALALLSR